MREEKLAVSEVFYSIQGEGKTMGFPAVFVRLGGCNLICGGKGTIKDGELHNNAEWRCDSIEVWTKAKSKPFNEILGTEEKNAIKNGANLILTGGEPLMQQKKLSNFIKFVRNNYNKNVFVEIETNGTIEPNSEMLQEIDLFNCSPKTLTSGNPNEKTYKPQAIKTINSKSKDSIFKFVIFDSDDYEEILRDYYNIINKDKIWLMPAGENQSLLSDTKERVADIAKKNNLKFTTRLHIDIWNQKTGV